jgi:UDP-N-acetylenolpyruvoylglucosamine reductase
MRAPEVLGDLGYLPEKQNRIESLSLITGAGCIWNVDGQSSVVLSEFKCLRRMFWKGLRSVEDFEASGTVFKQNRNISTNWSLISSIGLKQMMLGSPTTDDGTEAVLKTFRMGHTETSGPRV